MASAADKWHAVPGETEVTTVTDVTAVTAVTNVNTVTAVITVSDVIEVSAENWINWSNLDTNHGSGNGPGHFSTILAIHYFPSTKKNICLVIWYP